MEKAIEHGGVVLAGCRDSLRDYLALGRVDNPSAYVYRVTTCLEGADEWMWSDRTGKKLEPERRTKILAAAFNELALGDETGKHFPDPPGGFGNLRSKVRYLVASALGVERDAARGRKSAAAEEAEIVAKREAAKERSDEGRTRDEENKHAAHRRRMMDAKTWYDAQPKWVQQKIDEDAEARVRILYHDMRKAPQGYIEAAFLEAVNGKKAERASA